MTKEELIRTSLPELNWEDLDWCWRGTYFVVDISLIKNSGDWVLELYGSRLIEEVLRLFPSGTLEDNHRIVKFELWKYSIDDIKKFILGIKNWMSWIDSYKGSTEDIDQLVLIHPDVDDFNAPCFLRDFKVIVDIPDGDGGRLGILSTKKWNLGNQELLELILNDTGDCFSIVPDQLSEESIYLDPEFWAGLEELEKVYPGAKDIKRIYYTDFD